MKNCGMKLSEYFEIIIERNKKISVKDRLKNLLTIFKECCKTVKIIHDLGYLHLDIKPENFLINDNNQVKIIDFGLCVRGVPDENLNRTNSEMLAMELNNILLFGISA